MARRIRELDSSSWGHGLCRDCILVLNNAVLRTDQSNENAAMAAGARLARGSADMRDLRLIGKWKSPRSVHHFPVDGDAEAESRLRDAASEAASDEQRLEALLGIPGIGVPIASSILTCMNPKKFTVIDVRALDAIGAGPPPNSQERYRDLYLLYLDFCRSEAMRLRVDLRVLDRALWKTGAIS